MRYIVNVKKHHTFCAKVLSKDYQEPLVVVTAEWKKGDDFKWEAKY